MLNYKKTVIYLDRSTIRFGQVFGNQVKNEQILAENWKPEDLEMIFQKIKKMGGSFIHVIFGDDLSYVLYEKITLKNNEVLEDRLRKIVAERIPEDFNTLNWNHQILRRTETEFVVQITGFATTIYEQVNQIVEKLGIKVIKFHSLSLCLVNQFSSDEPLLFAYDGYRKLAIIAYQSAVVGSELLNTNDYEKEVGDLIFFVKEKYKLVVKDTLKRDLHPMLGAVVESKTKILKKKEVEKVKKDFNPAKNIKLVLVLIILLISVLLLLLYFRGWLPVKFNFIRPQSVMESPAEVITEPTPSEIEIIISPTPTPIDLGQYKLQILNGNGIAGLAGEVVDILRAEGFSSFETGNAENYNYTKSIVQLKDGVPKEVYFDIERALNSDFDISLNEQPLNEDLNYDLIIILGIKK